MTGWGMPEVATALPDTPPAILPTPESNAAQTQAMNSKEASTTQAKNPQEHGWAPKTDYDYSTYMKSTKELAEAEAAAKESAAPGVEVGGWASNAATYEWNEDFGDVGPRHPELEKQLFGSENHVRMGIKFENLTTLDVHQEGDVRITPIRKFEDAGLHPIMLENVKLAGYNVPTPIQQYCMPAIKLGHDIVACAQTGSGKTAAFLVPIISKLMGKAKKLTAPRPNPATYQEGISPRVRAEPLVLVVCPSRELATQIFDEARRFCYRSMFRPCVVYGGGPIAEQIRQLQKGCDILIGTPGRLVDFINRPETLTLNRLKYMVIDEADEMLQSDWEEELNKIMSGGDQEEGNIKYLLFSATFPKAARDLAKQHLAHVHVRIRVGRAGSSHLNIKQDIVYVESSMKRRAVEDLLLSTPPTRTIIFVNSKRSADELDDFLFNKNFPCVSIHSGRTQREREDCIRSFRLGKNPILIATGVSARGLDIHNVMHVINYDLPSTQYGGIEEYTHRIGRTGRIGNMGLATSFYNDRDIDLAENLTKTLLETHQPVPDFLEQYIPEGFTADGSGDINKLKFEADSDYGEDDGAGGTPAGAATDAWGAPPAGADPWGSAPTTAPEVAIPQASSDALEAAASSTRAPISSQAPVQEAWNGAVTTPPVPSPIPVQVLGDTSGAVPTSTPASAITAYPAAPMAQASHLTQAAQFAQPPSFSPVAYATPTTQAPPTVPAGQQWAPLPVAVPNSVPIGVAANAWPPQVVPHPTVAATVPTTAQALPTGPGWSHAPVNQVQSAVTAITNDQNIQPTAPVIPTAAPAPQPSPWEVSGGWNTTSSDDW